MRKSERKRVAFVDPLLVKGSLRKVLLLENSSENYSPCSD